MEILEREILRKVISQPSPPPIFIDHLEEHAIPRLIMDLDAFFEPSSGPLLSGLKRIYWPKGRYTENSERHKQALTPQKLKYHKGFPYPRIITCQVALKERQKAIQFASSSE